MSSYASLSALYTYGAPEKAFGQLSSQTKLDALEAASREVDTYLRGRYLLPLLAWDLSITRNTCALAAYDLLVVRGYNPAAGSDPVIESRYNKALDWLNKVQRQQAHPDVTPSQADAPNMNQPTVISSSVVNLATGGTATRRGW